MDYQEYKEQQNRIADAQTNKQINDRTVKKIKRFNKVTENVNRSGGKAFKNVSKSVRYSKKLSNRLLSYANAFGGSNAQKIHQGAGRPRGSLKWRSPFNGQPIPATEYYKQVRMYRNIQAQKAGQVERQRISQFANKGIPPNQIQKNVMQTMMNNYNQMRMNQQTQVPVNQNQIQQMQNPEMNQMQNQVQMINGKQIIPRGTNVWKWRRGEVGTEGGLFGKTTKIYGLPESFFN